MAAVHTSKVPGGMQDDFEACVAHIVPYFTISKNRTTVTKQGAAEISEVKTDDGEAEILSFGSKPGKGPKTGVHIRYQKNLEYCHLLHEETDEFWEWQKSQNLDEKNPKWNKDELGYK